MGFALIEPGAMNVIPGRVELGIDIRDICHQDKEIAVQKIQDLMEEIQDKRGLAISHEILSSETPVPLSGHIIRILEQEAAAMGISHKRMISGAGHDAMNMAKIALTGMIFVPSIKGISHNIAERTDFKDIMAGCDLLYRTVVQLANLR